MRAEKKIKIFLEKLLHFITYCAIINLQWSAHPAENEITVYEKVDFKLNVPLGA